MMMSFVHNWKDQSNKILFYFIYTIEKKENYNTHSLYIFIYPSIYCTQWYGVLCIIKYI